jgi:hypothetical protein
MSRSPPASQDALVLKLLSGDPQSLEAFGLSESQKSSRSRGPLPRNTRKPPEVLPSPWVPTPHVLASLLSPERSLARS